MEELEKEAIEEKKIENLLTIEQKQSLVDIFDEPELEEELRLLKEQEKKQVIIEDNIDLETGELIQPINNKQNEYIAILQEIFDNKLEVLL